MILKFDYFQYFAILSNFFPSLWQIFTKMSYSLISKSRDPLLATLAGIK